MPRESELALERIRFDRLLSRFVGLYSRDQRPQIETIVTSWAIDVANHHRSFIANPATVARQASRSVHGWLCHGLSQSNGTNANA
jgi:hypothetical protein